MTTPAIIDDCKCGSGTPCATCVYFAKYFTEEYSKRKAAILEAQQRLNELLQEKDRRNRISNRRFLEAMDSPRLGGRTK